MMCSDLKARNLLDNPCNITPQASLRSLAYIVLIHHHNEIKAWRWSCRLGQGLLGWCWVRLARHLIILLLPRYPRIFHLPPLTLSVLIWTAVELLMLVKALVEVWMGIVLLGIVVVLVKLLPL
jgi:hypothetical protein